MHYRYHYGNMNQSDALNLTDLPITCPLSYRTVAVRIVDSGKNCSGSGSQIQIYLVAGQYRGFGHSLISDRRVNEIY